MPQPCLDRRISPLGLLAASGLHVAAFVGVASFGAVTAPAAPQPMMAQLIVPEAPPAPAVEPPRPKPAEPPPPVRRKPAPVAKPRPAPPPKVLAAPSPEPAEVAAVAPAPEIPEPPAPPAPAAPPPPPARAVPAAPPAPVQVSAPRFDADYLDNPPPAYPPLSRRMREEGRVMLRVFVEPDGRPSQVAVKEGSGSPRLDRAAEEAVRRWKFVPARRGEETVGAWVLVPIVFSLRG